MHDDGRLRPWRRTDNQQPNGNFEKQKKRKRQMLKKKGKKIREFILKIWIPKQ